MACTARMGRSTLLVTALGLVSGSLATMPAQAQTSGVPASTVESTAARLGIRVAPVILAEPEVETPISIQVSPDTAVPRQTFLRIRNLPLAAKLSEGHVVTPGIWAVPLSALPSLRLLAPLSSSGRTEIQIALVGVDGSVMAEARSSLVVAPAWLLGSSGARADAQRVAPSPRIEQVTPTVAVPTQSQVVAQSATQTTGQTVAQAATQTAATVPAREPQQTAPREVARPDPAPIPQPAVRPATTTPNAVAALPPQKPLSDAAPAAQPARATPLAVPTAPATTQQPASKGPPPLSAADRQRAESMVQRGDTFLRQGNVAAARQFFRRAADMGLANGALRLGSTYDPSELASLSLVGLNPDPKEAAQWYERAGELGAPEAGARLSRLQGR